MKLLRPFVFDFLTVFQFQLSNMLTKNLYGVRYENFRENIVF